MKTKTDKIRIARLSKLKKNSFFRFHRKKKVFVFLFKHPEFGCYYHPANDARDIHSTAPYRIVDVGFTYRL